MSRILGTLMVSPLYGQVVVECENATDLPVPETGQERVVATTESLLVATRGDQEGGVLMEVREGPADDLGVEIFDGELSLKTPKLVFGSSLGNQLNSVDLGRVGWLPIKVFVTPAEAPSRVVVLVP